MKIARRMKLTFTKEDISKMIGLEVTNILPIVGDFEMTPNTMQYKPRVKPVETISFWVEAAEVLAPTLTAVHVEREKE